MTERELLQIQIRSYEFYADLITRSVTGTGNELPRWNQDKAELYLQLADQYRQRLKALEVAESQEATGSVMLASETG
jgi:hypothetical protein